jgi:hypothetical protein
MRQPLLFGALLERVSRGSDSQRHLLVLIQSLFYATLLPCITFCPDGINIGSSITTIIQLNVLNLERQFVY